MVGVIPNEEENENDRLQPTDCFQPLPIIIKSLIFSKLISSGHYSDIKFLCRCSLVSKAFREAIPFVSSLCINHYCLEELCEFLPKVLKKFKWVKYLYVHHESPRSLNNFNWKVTFQLSSSSADCVTYGLTALSYNSMRKRSGDVKIDFCSYPLRLARPDTRIQCMSTERYVMQMSKLHDILMLYIKRLPRLRHVHVTDLGDHGTLVLGEGLLNVLRDSRYESRKAKRKKLGWFVANLPMDEFVMRGITSNIILKWKIPNDITDYNGIATFFNLQQSKTVYDKAILSILQHHKESVQEGYNNKLVYPDCYEAMFKTPLPVSGMYSEGSLKFGVGLKRQLSPYVARLLPNQRKQMMRTDYIKDMYSHDSNVQLTGTTKLAGLLAEDPRLGDLRSEDVHFLIGLLENGEKPELQFYAALALSYVDSNGALIIRMKAIPLLVDLMTSKHVDTQMRGMFILMRIAYDFPNSVGDLHKIGAWELLKDLVYIHQENYYELLNCATFLSIVCRAKAYLSAHEIREALRISKLLLQYGVYEVKPKTLLALSYLSHGSYVTLEQNLQRFILEHILHVDPLIVIITLQVIGNIMAWGSYNQKKFMLEKDLLKNLHSLSHREYKILRYEACRIIQIIEKERQVVSLPLNKFRIHQKKGTALCSIIENVESMNITDLAENDDDFLETLPIKVDSKSLDMSSFVPLSKNEEVTTKFLNLKWMAESYTSKEFSY